MYHDAAGKVDHAPAHEQPFGVPGHVSQRTVDEEEKEHHEEHVGRKTYTLGEGTRDERWGDDGELHLEQGKQCQRNRGTTQYIACGCRIDRTTHIMKHRECQRITNHTAYIVAKAKRETNDHPKHGYQSHGDKRLQHRRDHILRTYHAAVEERQTWCHHQNENRGCNEPRHVGR